MKERWWYLITWVEPNKALAISFWFWTLTSRKEMAMSSLFGFSLTQINFSLWFYWKIQQKISCNKNFSLRNLLKIIQFSNSCFNGSNLCKSHLRYEEKLICEKLVCPKLPSKMNCWSKLLKNSGVSFYLWLKLNSFEK